MRAGAFVAVASLGALLAASMPARADDKLVCKEAYESAQIHMKGHQPLAATTKLRICAQNACPAFLRADCLSMLETAEKAVPSVVFSARVDGNDTFAVRVSHDGKELASRLDGTAIELEPGPYVFHFEREGAPPKDVTVIVKEGEKGRVVPVVWETAKASNETPNTTPAAPAPEEPPKARPVPWTVWASLGAGVVAAGVGAGTYAAAESKRNELENTCKPFCTQSEVDGARSLYVTSTVAFSVAGAALVTAGVLYWLRPEKPADERTAIVPLASPTGGGASLVGRF